MLGIFGKRAAKTQEDPIRNELRQLMMQGTRAQENGDANSALTIYQRGLQLARANQRRESEQTFLNSIGAVQVGLSYYAQAEQSFEAALQLAEALQHQVLIARSLNNLGELYASQEQWEKAQSFHEKALENARAASDMPTIILALENLARDYMSQNNPHYAVHLLKEAVTLAQIKQDSYLGIGVLGRLGEATIETGDYVAGRKLIEQAIRLSMTTNVSRPRLVMRWLLRLGDLDLEGKQYRRAANYFRQAEEIAHRFGVQSSNFFLNIAMRIANTALHLGDYPVAFDQASRAKLHAQQLHTDKQLAQVIGYLGLAQQGLNRHADAIPNLEKALSYYENETLEDMDEQGRLFLALGRSFQAQEQPEKAREIFQQVLDTLDPEENPVRRAEALQLVAAIHNVQQERDEAIRLYQEAQQLFADAGEKHRVARVLCDIGSTRRNNGDFKGALTDFENALVLLSGIDDRITRGLVLSNAAIIYTETGDIDTALSFYKESIQLAKETKDRFAEGVRTGNLGWLQLSIGRYHAAIATLESAIAISRELSAYLPLAIQTNNLGWVYFLQGEFSQSQQLLDQALGYLDHQANRQWNAIILSNLAEVKMKQGDLVKAEEFLITALADSQAVLDTENVIRTQLRQARLYLEQEKVMAADALAQEAEAAARRMYYRKGLADALKTLGATNAARRQIERAKYFYQEAGKIYRVLQDPLATEVIEKADKL